MKLVRGLTCFEKLVRHWATWKSISMKFLFMCVCVWGGGGGVGVCVCGGGGGAKHTYLMAQTA